MDPPVIFQPELRELLGWIAGSVVAVFWGVQAMVRRFSKTTVEFVRDRAEIDSIQGARKEISALGVVIQDLRIELTAAYRESNDRLREIGALTSRVETLIVQSGTQLAAIQRNTEVTIEAGHKVEQVQQAVEKIEANGPKNGPQSDN